MPCTLRRSGRFRAHHQVRLGPGRSAAPGKVRLVLLPSGPDTVRELPLRGTRPSTSLEVAAFESGDLGREFSPAGADCRFRAPLVPRLARRRKSIRGGGEGGIRTRDGLPRTAFPVRRHSPLGDLSPARRNPVGAFPTGCRIRAGGEGGIRTRGAFAHRFSRAAPSTTRTPLRDRGYQTRDARPSRPFGRRTAPRRYERASPTNNSSASSRRIPLTTRRRREREP